MAKKKSKKITKKKSKKVKEYKTKISRKASKRSMYKPLFNLSVDIKEAMPKGKLTKDQKVTLKRYKDQLAFEEQSNQDAKKEKIKIRKRLEKRHASEKTIKREQNKVFTYDLDLIKNKINMITRKPFYFTVTDGLQAYRISSKFVKKSDNPGEYVIKQYIKQLQKEIDKEGHKPKKKRNVKRLKALNEMMVNAKRHENVIVGRTESFAKGEYPAFVTMFAEVIDLHI